MRRFAAISAATAALVMLTAGPALAQYDGEGGTSSTSTSSTTTTAPAAERVAYVTPDVANPGRTATFQSQPVFAPGSAVTIVLVRGQQGADGTGVATATVRTDGSVAATFAVPATTPPGVYFVYAQGVDENGNPVRAVAILVVLPAGQAPTAPAAAVATASGSSTADAEPEATSTDGTAGTESSAPASIDPPPEVQRLQLTAEAEQQLVDEVAADDDAHVVIDGEQLSVASGETSNSSAPVTAGVAAGFLVLAGAIALRTRRSHRH